MSEQGHSEDRSRRRRGRPAKPIEPRNSARSRLGRALRQVREAADVSLIAFSGESEYSRGHLSRVEHGHATPSRELVAAYEARFHTDGLLLSLYQTVLDEQEAARLARRGAAGQPPPAPGTLTPRTHPGDRSEFVCDLNLDDGEVVAPGERFEKRWRIRNAGSVPWQGRALERIGACAGPAIIASPHRVPIPDTMPGETVDISAALTAPALPGSTIAYWQMVDSEGRPCFPDRYADGIYAELVVRDGPM